MHAKNKDLRKDQNTMWGKRYEGTHSQEKYHEQDNISFLVD